MSGVPRSQRLMTFQWTTAGYSAAWECPANFVTLVKSYYAVQAQASGTMFQVIVDDGNSANGITIARYTLETNVPISWEGFLVLNPADRVYFTSDQIGPAVWLSGAILAGGPQFAPASRGSPRVEPHS